MIHTAGSSFHAVMNSYFLYRKSAFPVPANLVALGE